MTKAKSKKSATADTAARETKEAEFLKILGQNAGKSGALVHSALTTHLLARLAPGGELNQQDVWDGVNEGSAAIARGDMKIVERMLYAQMVTLNAVFAQCVSRATSNMGEYLDATERYMRLGLKAQAQCSRAAEVLGNLRSGPTVFAKQANIAHGHQQVNNGPVPQSAQEPRAQETMKPANELLEDDSHEQQWMDAGTQAAPTGGDTAMETVGAVNRATNGRGQSERKSQ